MPPIRPTTTAPTDHSDATAAAFVGERCAGLLLHPTSLPGPFGIGTLGDAAFEFLDRLEAAGMRRWQVLPLVPPAATGSPYASSAALAGSHWLIDLERLVGDGLLAMVEIEPLRRAGGVRGEAVDWPEIFAGHGPVLHLAAGRLCAGGHALHDEFVRWSTSQRAWLDDAALFAALHDAFDDRPWMTWPAGLRDRRRRDLDSARRHHAAAIDRQRALQFLVDRQWQAVRASATARGIRLIGDVPIYVSGDSVDVWANRGLFQLDPDGNARDVAGVPPDDFSETGQRWGNPLYDWHAHHRQGFDWWCTRIARALEWTDIVRIDHFRGLSACWAIPAEAVDARAGRWLPGPGIALFEALAARFGALPVIAEDLGIIDEDVDRLRVAAGLPGMRVLQFGFGAPPSDTHLPHNYSRDAVVYPGTHDNDTVRGWYDSAPEFRRDHVRRYLCVNGRDIAWDLIRAAFASVADTAIVAVQDVLGLGSEARMNTPALCDGSWSWRMPADALTADHTGRLRELVWLYRRDGST